MYHYLVMIYRCYHPAGALLYGKNIKMSIIKTLIEDYPLYRKVEIDLKQINPTAINGSTYNSYCPLSKDIQTFELEFFPGIIKTQYGGIGQYKGRIFLELETKDHQDITYDTQHYKGICKCCNEFKQDIILNILSNRPDPKSNVTGAEVQKYFIRKIGQFPSFSIKPEPEVREFLTEENLEFYKKALMNISTGYGIGAFAYLRRIIENEILNICNRISELDSGSSSKINDAIEKYQKNHQMKNLIDEIYPHVHNL